MFNQEWAINQEWGSGKSGTKGEGGEGGRLRIGSGLGLVQGSSLGGRGFPPLFAPWSGF